MARAGKVGALTIDKGTLFAAVHQGDDAWTVSISLPLLSAEAIATFVELVAAESGRIAGLLDGELAHQLVEDAEDAGVELLPYGGEFSASCSCDAWAQPCPHALAVLTQFTWLIDDDPLALLHLRGHSREELLAALHERTLRTRVVGAAAEDAQGVPAAHELRDGEVAEAADADVEIGVDAARRAALILSALGRGDDVTSLL